MLAGGLGGLIAATGDGGLEDVDAGELVARDHGCSFPGCAHPPECCERHHIRAWLDGGRTDLDNLTLVWRYHRHNFAARGWACRLNPDGLPEWIPPRHVNRSQTPLINTRIQAALTRYSPAA